MIAGQTVEGRVQSRDRINPATSPAMPPTKGADNLSESKVSGLNPRTNANQTSDPTRKLPAADRLQI